MGFLGGSDSAGLAGQRLARALQQVALAEPVPRVRVLALRASTKHSCMDAC